MSSDGRGGMLMEAAASAVASRRTEEKAAVTCPACGGENAPDAVFCTNPGCHKALGEFEYALAHHERGPTPPSSTQHANPVAWAIKFFY